MSLSRTVTVTFPAHMIPCLLVKKHLADRHLADRHLADRHLADRHLAGRHLADRHFALTAHNVKSLIKKAMTVGLYYKCFTIAIYNSKL